ncbi:MAG: sulfatase-like hydrolase/transferase [Bryobacteraceae bacterium]|nr:sulfatase-like hydrolase/transferase [Bryobacteraceae bacterium]
MIWSRRSFLAAAPAALLAQRKGAPAPARPNIALVLAEDVPAWALSCYGNKEIRTPNLDQLTRAGTRFTNNLATVPVAEQNRQVLLTGSLKGGQGLAERLNAAGYRAGTFSEVTEAAGFIDQQAAGAPFFLTVSLAGANGPAGDFAAQYAAVKFEQQGLMQGAPNADHQKEKFNDLQGSFRAAAAAISRLDAEVAAVRKKLMQKGFFDNTLFIFAATNGMMLGRHGLWSDGRATEAGCLFEEVVQAPMIWSWPGRVPVQAIRPELVGSYDFVPTLCAVAGLEAPAGLPGRNYLPVVTSRALPEGEEWRDLVFARMGDAWMARDNRFKLINRFNSASDNEFYDLRQDPREFDNLIDDARYLTVKERLNGELAAWKDKNA